MIILKITKNALSAFEINSFKLYKDEKIICSFLGNYEYIESINGRKYINLLNNDDVQGRLFLDDIDKVYINDECIKRGR